METETDVLVIGGGATGCGVLRDLARRGIDATLVERDTLASGTSGRMHGLLHSGARYAVSDRSSARECMAENRILRDIAGHCIEDTGGLFVKRPEDPEAYFDKKLEGCRACDIPADVISGEQARHREPALADDIERAIAVPDAAIDPFRLCVANVRDAEDHGARVETHATVVDVVREGATVSGAVIEHQSESETAVEGSDGTRETIHAEHVVNATGAWAGQVGELAGVDIEVRPSKGAMTILGSRPVDTVINRCRPKGDGDILVPHETTAILGTTDELVSDPDDYPEEAREVDLLIESLAAVVPGLPDARTIRSYWGVRPLYEPPGDRSGAARDVTRDYFVLDHERRDGVSGLTTIVGGKLTTYRLMAESVTDQVCEKLGVSAESDTAGVSLPGSDNPAELTDAMDRFGLRSPVFQRSQDRLGSRTASVLDSPDPNPVLCQCEGVTRAEVQAAIEDVGPDLNAVRIRSRATMGPCQGGRCGHRIAAELHPEFEAPTIRNALDDLRTERWNGQRHALWGRQLSQAMLNYAHFRTTLNEDTPIQKVTVDWESFDDGHGGNDGD